MEESILLRMTLSVRMPWSDWKKVLLRCSDESIDVIYVADYAKGSVSCESTDLVRHLGAQLKCPIVVDPKGDDFGKYLRLTSITPNTAEAIQATKFECSDELQASAIIANELGLDSVS